MRITSAKNFKEWCDKAPKRLERIDFDNLPDPEKDKSVVAYCYDFGTPPMMSLALQLVSPSCSNCKKESAFRSTEHDIRYMVQQYNDLLDLRDAKLGDDYYENLGFCENAFQRVFNSNQHTIYAGHKPADFC